MVKRIVTCALVVAFASTLAGVAIADDNDSLAVWGNKTLVRTDPPNRKPTASRADDFFTLEPGGTGIGTAGSGSEWFYDPTHHIAAASSHGDVSGVYLLYADAPPGRVRARDLSHVVSARGLRLGLSPAQIVAIVGASPTAVVRTSATVQVLYLRRDRMCGTAKCAHDETFIFERGKAVAITLANIGP